MLLGTAGFAKMAYYEAVVGPYLISRLENKIIIESDMRKSPSKKYCWFLNGVGLVEVH